MVENIFEKINQRTIQHEVVDMLRDAIVAGRLELGSHLREVQLAEQMQVSRVPIREALRQLEQEGLVTRQPNRGCFVISLNNQDVIEIFSLRATLEIMSIEWAVKQMKPADYAYLKKVINDQAAAVETRDYEHLAQLDMQFHEYILQKTNHSRLLKEWQQQHTQCKILLNRRFQFLSNETPETVLRDHTEIVNAMERGDVNGAITLIKQISERVTRECIQVLAALAAPDLNGRL